MYCNAMLVMMPSETRPISFSSHLHPGVFGEDFSIFANKKTSCYSCRHHQGYHSHHRHHHQQHCQHHHRPHLHHTHHHANHQHPPHHSLLPLPQVLSNYAIDEIYIRETPSWMFKEENVLNQNFQYALLFGMLCFQTLRI